jgi:hypothetical protein
VPIEQAAAEPEPEQAALVTPAYCQLVIEYGDKQVALDGKVIYMRLIIFQYWFSIQNIIRPV